MKRFALFLTTVLICLGLLFTIRLSFDDKNKYRWLQFSEKKKAFATVICDTTMVEPTLVSLYTLNSVFAKTSISSDIIVLISKEIDISQEQLDQFKKLNTTMIKDSSYDSCHSVINLWALLDYQKIIYFTPDVLFENNIEPLFELPGGSAMYTNHSYTPLFIIEPNANTFESLVKDIPKLSPRLSLSQLLVQHYFKDQRPLSHHYVHVLEGPMKPWNFHLYHGSDWSKQLDPSLFYKWRRAHHQIKHTESDLRQRTVCDSYVQQHQINTFPIHDQFSVLISTYNPDRIEHISLLIRHMLSSSLVHIIYITWHNPNLQVPDSLFQHVDPKDRYRVQILLQTFDSLNNRFNPIDQLLTSAVYIMDDDIYIDIEDLEFAFKVWQNRKDSVVGHFPRLHTYINGQGTYKVITDAPYSIVLTKSMFIRSDYLFSYTCLLDPQLHQYVDDHLNCEDIGFMMMTSGTSGVGSTFVKTEKPMYDMGLSKGISTNGNHMSARAQCISDFIQQFWYHQDPLVLSFESITRFQKPSIKTGHWNKIQTFIA